MPGQIRMRERAGHHWRELMFAGAVTLVVAGGCAGAGQPTAQGKMVGSAVGKVAGAVIGHQVGETGIGSSVGSDLGGVAGSMAGSAAQSRQPSREVQERVAQRKFCPIDGARYPDTLRYCPDHGVELRPLAD